jgi:hypothetical protein
MKISQNTENPKDKADQRSNVTEMKHSFWSVFSMKM